jgi:hypothetical protein
MFSDQFVPRVVKGLLFFILGLFYDSVGEALGRQEEEGIKDPDPRRGL